MSELIQIRACRVCLKTKVEELKNIFSNDLAEKFQFCCDIKVNHLERRFAPNYLCTQCIHIIQSFAEFKQKCLKSDAFWKATCQPLVKFEKSDEIPLSNIQIEEAVIEEFKSDNDSRDYTDNIQIDYVEELKVETEPTNEEQLDDKTVVNDQSTNENTKFVIKKPPPNIKSVIEKKKKFTGQCKNCSRVFSYKGRLRTHLQNCSAVVSETKKHANKIYEPTPATQYCGLCEMSTKTQSELFAHLMEHEKAATLTCSLCDFKAIDLADFMAHRLKHQPEEWKDHIHRCHKNCKKRYRIMDNYEFHYRKVHLKKTPGLCKLCDKVYTCIRTWRTHLATHSQKPRFECDTCGRKFYVKDHFIQHMQTHDDKKDAICELCGFATKRRSYLKVHLQSCHSAHPQVACKICGKTYRNAFGLDSHMVLVHQEKKFPCQVCGKRFPTKNVLKSHEIWHSDHRPHKCPKCPKTFKVKWHLVQHVETHNAVKSFMCDVCGKCFNTNKLLTVHRRRNAHLKIDD